MVGLSNKLKIIIMCHRVKGLSGNTVMSYWNLINLYLRDCVEMKKEPIIQWSHPAGNS